MPQDVIYLNAASHGLPDDAVRRRILAYVQREAEVGPVHAAREVEQEILTVREKAADLIGAQGEDVAFTQTTMSGWSGAVAALPFKGRRILVTPDEWGECAQMLARIGKARDMQLEVMATTADGDIDVAAVKASLDDDVAAVSMPMVSSLRGRRLPVEDIGALPRPDHCFFIIDGAQALGQISVDVDKIGCDVFAATARKWLRSARGTAILYVRRSTLERMDPVPVLDASARHVGSEAPHAGRFESFDFVVPLRLAFGAAIDVLNARGMAALQETVREHARHVRNRVDRAGLELASPPEAQSGITSFHVPGEAIEHVSQRLAARDILVKLPPASDEPLRPGPSNGAVLMRVSPHVYNTSGEIDALFDEIAAVA